MIEITYDDFIGKDKLEKLERFVRSKQPVILWGDPGTGKTTSVYLVAKKLGYKVVEFNASDERSKEDLQKLLKDVQMRSLVPKIYLFDEADGLMWWGIVSKILDNSKYPIVFTANDIKAIPEFIKEKCEVIRYYPPRKRDLVELLRKKFGDKIHFDKITDDVRQTLIAVIYNTEPYRKTDFFKELENLFKHGEVNEWDDVMWIWIIDNLDYLFDGRELFEKVKFVADVAMYNYPPALKGLRVRTAKKLTFRYPYFLERKKALENENGGKN